MNNLVTAEQADKLLRDTINKDEDQYLTFQLGSELYALSILRVKEILEFGRLTPVPLMPKFVRGVLNLRGHVVPLIDMKLRFGHDLTEVSKRTCNIIIEIDVDGAAYDIGMMVDAVAAVLVIPESDIEPAPSFGTKLRADFISGMGRVGEAFVIILDVDQVLAMDEMAALVAQLEQ